MECPLCKIAVKNVHLHLTRMSNCGNKIDMDHFSNTFETYKKNLRKQTNLEAAIRYQTKLKAADPESFRLGNNEAERRKKKKQKDADPESFRIGNNEAEQRKKKKQKEADPESFRISSNEAEQRKKKKQKEADPESFRLDTNEAQQRKNKKQKDADPESFRIGNKEAEQRKKKKQKDADPVSFNEKNRKAVTKSRSEGNRNVVEHRRILKFNKAVLFGPIFICSCCSRKLFENGVTKITPDFKKKVDEKRSNFSAIA